MNWSPDLADNQNITHTTKTNSLFCGVFFKNQRSKKAHE